MKKLVFIIDDDPVYLKFMEGHFSLMEGFVTEVYSTAEAALDVYLLQGTEVLFHKKLDRPHDCIVSNEGVVAVCDWLHANELVGRFVIFNKEGDQIVKVKTSGNLGSCAISGDSRFAIFETYHSDTDDSEKIFIINIDQQKVVGKFRNEFDFKKANINSDDRVIGFQIRTGSIMKLTLTELGEQRKI